MRINTTMELLKTYGKCPRCGNDKLGKNQGSLGVKDKIFIRECNCGYKIKITTDEDGNVIEKLFSAKKCENN